MKPTVRKMRSAGNKMTQSALGKGKGKSKGRYSSFIYRVFKQDQPHTSFPSLSKETTAKETCFYIADEAARLSLYNKRKTITCQEIQFAAKLLQAVCPV
ncbi:late histone H2B.2.2 [Xenopus laevis]|uniref:Late histone H2B.2.2 n=2 Tax=Xenopus laevis TaxID=8355 RepID=A0A1L8ENU1_XENLA|nr:late histone H2B.2.2 [Xenopus laevis]OCT61026.1 hypothetical protein XELAEV_18047052mg [Xenopus laevis]